jgi:hypothetical protein
LMICTQTNKPIPVPGIFFWDFNAQLAFLRWSNTGFKQVCRYELQITSEYGL